MCRKSIGFHLSRLVTLLENLESHLNTWNLFCTWNYTLKTEASANNTIITLCQSNRTKILGTLITVFFPAQNFRFSFAIDLAIYWENLDLHPYPLHARTQAGTHARTHARTHTHGTWAYRKKPRLMRVNLIHICATLSFIGLLSVNLCGRYCHVHFSYGLSHYERCLDFCSFPD